MPVLYGVFLYMGVASLNGVQVDFAYFLFLYIYKIKINNEELRAKETNLNKLLIVLSCNPSHWYIIVCWIFRSNFETDLQNLYLCYQK